MATHRRLAALNTHLLGGPSPPAGTEAAASPAAGPDPATPPPERVLSFHLQHPGGESSPGDPNAAFCLDGVYHLHYILQHDWQDGGSFSFVHVTSTDMLHWEWQTTKLQPSHTGHGMFSGTGFVTKEGLPAAIYHGAPLPPTAVAVHI